MEVLIALAANAVDGRFALGGIVGQRHEVVFSAQFEDLANAFRSDVHVFRKLENGGLALKNRLKPVARFVQAPVQIPVPARHPHARNEITHVVGDLAAHDRPRVRFERNAEI